MSRLIDIPIVKPIITCSGINLIILPQCSSPMIINIMPAKVVAICSPSWPNREEVASNKPMKAPVGPEIWVRVPPNADTQNAAMMEVYSPISGLTFDPIANAIDSGIVTIPTTIPAKMFGKMLFLLNRPARANFMRAIIQQDLLSHL